MAGFHCFLTLISLFHANLNSTCSVYEVSCITYYSTVCCAYLSLVFSFVTSIFSAVRCAAAYASAVWLFLYCDISIFMLDDILYLLSLN